LPDDADKWASMLLVLLRKADRERRWQKLCFLDV
jgi:hypothetical protein